MLASCLIKEHHLSVLPYIKFKTIHRDMHLEVLPCSSFRTMDRGVYLEVIRCCVPNHILFLLYVYIYTAAVLTKCILLHAVCTVYNWDTLLHHNIVP